MLDPSVHDVHIQHGLGFDPRTFLPSGKVFITYMVGTHGPFTDTTPDENLTEQYLEQITNRRVKLLRDAGLLPTP